MPDDIVPTYVYEGSSPADEFLEGVPARGLTAFDEALLSEDAQALLTQNLASDHVLYSEPV